MATTLRDLVGQVEIAERLRVSRTTVAKWRTRPIGFPLPRLTISGTPIWLWPEVLDWFQARGRTTDTRETPSRSRLTPSVKPRAEVEPVFKR